MVDNVQRPTIGPTKDLDAARALDAQIPNPDYVCLPPAEVATYLTSKVYPLYAQDGITEEQMATAFKLIEILPEYLRIDGQFMGGTLVTVISYGTYGTPEEYLRIDGQFTGGTLVQVIGYKTYGTPEEYLTMDNLFLSATLVHVIGYIFITQPPDNVSEEMWVSGITLTPS